MQSSTRWLPRRTQGIVGLAVFLALCLAVPTGQAAEKKDERRQRHRDIQDARRHRLHPSRHHPTRIHPRILHRRVLRPHSIFDHGFGCPISTPPRPRHTLQHLLARRAEMGQGALDMKVRPKKARVLVDGEDRGPAKRLDGFPDFLWLEEGEHTVTLQREGFESVSRSVEVRAGVVREFEARLEREP